MILYTGSFLPLIFYHQYNRFSCDQDSYQGDREGGVRGCGAVEAVLANPDVSVDFILDGEHVEPAAVEMAIACKGRNKVCLITDANLNAGLPAGRYKGIGNREIIVEYEGGPARMLKSLQEGKLKGGLCGSGLTLARAVRNAVKFLGLDIPQAVSMASANPAQVLGLHQNKGHISEGYDADMVMLDRELKVVRCWTGGICRFSREE